MVTGYDESRFFKRHDQVVLRMTEPEIREAYGRIAASRMALEASLEREVEEALAARKDARESIIAVPWYGSPRLLDPRELTSFRTWLKAGPLASAPLVLRLEPHLGVCTSGFRSGPQGYKMIDYLAAHKTGLIHLSSKTCPDDSQRLFSALDLLERLSIFLLIAKRLLDQAGYWGPVRVVHTLRLPPQFDLITHRQFRVPGNLTVGQLTPGHHTQLVYDVVLRDATSFAPIIQEILDQVFHIASTPECPWFEPSGTIDQSLRSMLTSGGAPVASQILGA
jgi:hypothetical protein